MTFPHVMIRASAGTGKTYQLSNRYLGLAAAGAPPEAILASTFTRKAAGEILDRVLTRLAEAALDEAKCRELAEAMGHTSLNSERALDLLAHLVKHLHRLRISTLDGFFAQVAASFSLELGLPPGWRIVEEPVDQRLRSEAILDVLAGDGAKTTLTLMHLLSKGEAERSVSGQIRELVNSLYGLYLETPAEAWAALRAGRPLNGETLAAAIDALAAAPLPERERWTKARAADLASAQAGDWAGFIKGGLAGKVADGQGMFDRKPIEPDLTALYQKLVGHAKAVLVGQLADQTKATHQLLEKFDAHYQRLKQGRRALRFDDVTRSLARAAPAARAQPLAYRLDAELAHLLLDEFQDTSLWQWRVLRPMADPLFQGRDGVSSFFCVGDVKQAIYGWRGGEAELFDALGRDWSQLAERTLNESFRSSSVVIGTVNRVFARLEGLAPLDKHAAAVAGWAATFGEHTTARDKLPGHARLVVAPKAAEAADQKVETLKFAAAEIARLAGEAPRATIGALVRDNAAVARLIFELRRLDLHASEEGGNPLSDSPAVGVVLSLLTLADHPGDTVARFHVAGSPLAAALGLDEENAGSQAANRLAHHVRRALVCEGYGKTIDGWARKLAPACDRRDADRLWQLVELAYRYQAEATLRVSDFVVYVESQKVPDPTSSGVRVMTIHQAKGLEFDIVVLPQLDGKLIGQPPPVVVGRSEPTGPAELVTRYANKELKALLPGNVQAAFDAYHERVVRETLCVLYVALTRAIHALHMIVAPSSDNEKTLPAKYSGILRAALTDGQKAEASTVLYEAGDARWHRSVGNPLRGVPGISVGNALRGVPEGGPGSVVPGSAEQPAVLEVKLAAAGERRARMLERQSPSGLEGGTLVDLKQRLRLDTSTALLRGTMIHACFEQIEWLDDGAPSDEALAEASLAAGASRADVAGWLPQFREMLARPAIRAALSRHAYQGGAAWKGKGEILKALSGGDYSLNVRREQRFAIRDGDAILTGALDRLVVAERDGRPLAADLVDFKTDLVDDDSREGLKAIVAHYRPQIEAYRRAVARCTGLPPDRISARLVFVGAGLVARI
ncbi:MAG TPA: UvrD-helicase domain-containing protein [Pirellulales bacterium]|nr:UvrD-helicase domain-containing protein [Pirellulales bacterium]